MKQHCINNGQKTLISRILQWPAVQAVTHHYTDSRQPVQKNTTKNPVGARLVHLEVDVDVSDKLERGEERDRAQHEEEDVASERRVAEELHALQHARHVGALEVVEHGVQEDKDSC